MCPQNRADHPRVNVTLAALNLAIIAAVVGFVAYRKWRERPQEDVALPSAIRPNRPSQELADVVTEWAKVTGVLSPDGSQNGPPADGGLTDERN